MITIVLRGAPRGKGRPRHRIITPRPGTASWSKGKRKPFTISYTDDDTEAYEKALALVGKIAMGRLAPLEGPLEVTVTAIMPIPNSWPRKKRDAALVGTIRPTGKPDRDNIDKIVGDGLKGIAWVDDAQIVDGRVRKVYGEEPMVRVEFREAPNEGLV